MTEDLYMTLVVTLEAVSIGLIVAAVLIMIKGFADKNDDIAAGLVVVFLFMFFAVQYQIVTLAQMTKIPIEISKEKK